MKMNKLKRLLSTHPLGALYTLFALTRVALYGFWPVNREFLYSCTQSLDRTWLRADLLTSIVDLHTRPPLLNTFLGLCFQFDAPWDAVCCLGFHAALAIAGVYCFYSIAKKLISSGRLAFAISALYVIFPTLLYAEHWAGHYVHVITIGQLVLLWLIVCHPRGWPWWSFALATVLVLTRSIFHWVVWFLPVTVFLFVLIRKRCGRIPKSVVLLALVGLSVSVVPYVRNSIRFGVFSPATWQGFDLVATTMRYLPAEDKDKLIAAGHCSPLIKMAAESTTSEEYARALGMSVPQQIPGHPVLYERLKPTSGTVNRDYILYPHISKELTRSFVGFVIHRPKAYLKCLIANIREFFGCEVFEDWWTARAWRLDKNGDTTLSKLTTLGKTYIFSLLIFCAWCMTISAALWALFKERELVRRLLGGYVLFTLALTMAVPVLTESFEECVYRTPTDPILLLGAFVVLNAALSSRIEPQGKA